MSLAVSNGAARKTFAAGYVFGAPVQDLGVIAIAIMGLGAGFITFFATTFVGIVVVLTLNSFGHTADYTVSYRLIGLPCGVLMAVVSLAYLGTFWVKRILRKA
jgi:hypothetical protein